MSRDLVSFMLPTPAKLTARSVKDMFREVGLGGDVVKIWEDLGMIFIKKGIWVPIGEYILFCRVITRLGARYRKDYGVYILQVG